jgi:membrane fusion protein (multidrug efflux system)
LTDAGIRVVESKLAQAHAGEEQAHAELSAAQTAPSQVAATKARAASAEARVQQVRASLAQAELNLEYTVVKAPARGVVSRKSVNIGQVVQPGQPMLALVQIDDVWVTANFKETQLAHMRAGQRATISVDALGVTFQQFQKYERAINRISAGTLYQLSLTLEVPVQYFFEGLSGRRKKPR